MVSVVGVGKNWILMSFGCGVTLYFVIALFCFVGVDKNWILVFYCKPFFCLVLTWGFDQGFERVNKC